MPPSVAKIAVDAAIAKLAATEAELVSSDESHVREIAIASLSSAIDAVRQSANEAGRPATDYSSTLIIVMATSRWMASPPVLETVLSFLRPVKSPAYELLLPPEKSGEFFQ